MRAEGPGSASRTGSGERVHAGAGNRPTAAVTRAPTPDQADTWPRDRQLTHELRSELKSAPKRAPTSFKVRKNPTEKHSPAVRAAGRGQRSHGGHLWTRFRLPPYVNGSGRSGHAQAEKSRGDPALGLGCSPLRPALIPSGRRRRRPCWDPRPDFSWRLFLLLRRSLTSDPPRGKQRRSRRRQLTGDGGGASRWRAADRTASGEAFQRKTRLRSKRALRQLFRLYSASQIPKTPREAEENGFDFSVGGNRSYTHTQSKRRFLILQIVAR